MNSDYDLIRYFNHCKVIFLKTINKTMFVLI